MSTKIFDAYAAYYDMIYRDKDYIGESRYVEKALKRRGVDGPRLLELGCGTGRHAVCLARAGYRIHGIDLSTLMVQQANAQMPKDLADRLVFEQGDVRSARLPGHLGSFDAVIALFHVASYQTSTEDIVGMFRTAAEHLKPGGVFLFDFWHGPGVLSDPPSVRVKRMNEADLAMLRTAEPVVRSCDNVVEVHYDIVVHNIAEESWHRFSELHEMRYLFIPELSLLLRQAGFCEPQYTAWMGREAPGLGDWTAMATALREG